ncbi:MULTISPECIES: hypothetical protein [Methanomicrobiaceae]|jgi:hypothetical protein|uniref:hypothetical protein n=1 Tax=Methanomicrobiaceae TaxID=2194 RepID=UPI00316AE3D4
MDRRLTVGGEYEEAARLHSGKGKSRACPSLDPIPKDYRMTGTDRCDAVKAAYRSREAQAKTCGGVISGRCREGCGERRFAEPEFEKTEGL